MIELADSSAWFWSRRQLDLKNDFDIQAEKFEISTCDMVRLEVLHSARNIKEFHDIRYELDALQNCPITEEVWCKALDVYEELANQGGMHQRSVKHADLLIAAAAENAGVGLLHYDEDFDRIAKITKQPTRWLAKRGTLE